MFARRVGRELCQRRTRKRKELMPMVTYADLFQFVPMVTYADLFQFVIMLCAVATLIIVATRKK